MIFWKEEMKHLNKEKRNMQYNNMKIFYAQPYTLASLTNQRLNQNLPISMSLPLLKEMLTKFEMKNKGKKARKHNIVYK